MTTDDDTHDDENVAMQARCVHCLMEHYALNVIGVSYGESVCHNCGRMSRQMTRPEYLEALSATRERLTRIPKPRFPQ